MTFRAWLVKLIQHAEKSATMCRYLDSRIIAAERARILRRVLREMERANIDLADMLGRR